MKKLGAVVVFKDGVTPEQAEAALLTISHMIEGGYKRKREGEWVRTPTPTVHSYDPDYGEPVWYIP